MIKDPAQSPALSPAQSPVKGILWMVLTGLLFVCVNVIVKYVGPVLPAAESAFLRYALGLVFVLPMIRPILRARLAARQLQFFALRGVFHTFAVILWFKAMASIPMAEVTALGYLNPIFVTLGASLLLGEPLRLRRLLAVVAALVGALIILRPGLREILPGHLAQLGAAVCFSGSYLIAKRLSGEVSATVVVGMLSVAVAIGLAPFAFANWVQPTLAQAGWMFLVACFATAGHYTMTFAFAAAPLTVTQPVTFLQLVWAVSLGALFFGEPADAYVLLGGGVIIAAVSYIALREAALRRRITPAAHQVKG